jgi:hypothetical protein
VRSFTTDSFRRCFRGLPAEMRRQARAAYRRFQADPHHASLRFKQVHATEPIFSVRIGLGYRALGVKDGEDIIWFWIGSHADYDRLVARM